MTRRTRLLLVGPFTVEEITGDAAAWLEPYLHVYVVGPARGAIPDVASWAVVQTTGEDPDDCRRRALLAGRRAVLLNVAAHVRNTARKLKATAATKPTTKTIDP